MNTLKQTWLVGLRALFFPHYYYYDTHVSRKNNMSKYVQKEKPNLTVDAYTRHKASVKKTTGGAP